MSEGLNLIDISRGGNPDQDKWDSLGDNNSSKWEDLSADELEKMAADLEAEMGNTEVVSDKVEVETTKEADPVRVAEKIKMNRAIKVGIGASVAGAVALLATAGLLMFGNFNNEAKAPAPAPTPTTTEAPAELPEDNTVDIEENEASGIIDGYGEEGMWLSDGKTGPYAFADFEKVIEMHDGDVKGAVKDVASKQVESMADCISGMNDKVRPEGYQGLSMAEIDEKIENLSDVEYDLLKQEFENIIDKADVKEVSLNGKYDNAYMGVKDGEDKIIGSIEAKEKGAEVNHETMQLMKCTTNENGSKAYELTWTDENGNTIDSEMIKEACTQVVEQEGKNPTRFKGLPEATEAAIAGGGAMTVTITGGGPVITPPETPTPTPTPSPTPPPKKKWGKSGDPHAGTDYKQTIVANPVVPDISNINAGNQGYVDDMGANPGDASEYNGVSDSGFASSGIVAEGASTEGERLSGGEDQSDGNMAGENAYHSEAETSAGEARDEGGNQAQESAQESNDVGGDNNSDEAEVAKVQGGNF